jgi:hypothetical protein
LPKKAITDYTPDEKQKRIDSHYIQPPAQYVKVQKKPAWSVYNTTLAKKYSDADLLKYVSDPKTHYLKLQEASQYLWNTSKIYQNYVYYLSTIMTFDYILFPSKMTDSKKSNMLNKFIEAARIVYTMQPKYNFPYMLLKALLFGETYWYDVSDNETTIIQEVPSKYCQLAGIDENGLWRYRVNLDLISSTDLDALPMEIQKAYNNKGKGKENFYDVSDSGFAIFIHKANEYHDYPFFSAMFLDLNRLENDKDYFNNYLKDENIKLVHARVPLDKETGVPVMEKEVVDKYHNTLKENVPDNVAAMTNPFEMEGIDLNNSQKTGMNIVEVSHKNVQADSGVSETMFSASTTMGLQMSCNEDAATMYPLLSFFQNYVNFRLKSSKFKVQFLEINQYNQQDWNNQFATNFGTAGDLRTKYIATSQSDLYPFLMTAQLEQAIDIDSFMPSKESAFQASGNDPAGRPKTKKPTENTEKSRAQE